MFVKIHARIRSFILTCALCYSQIHDWPSYLKLEKRNHSRQLRSTSATTLTIPLITETFQDSASKLFNILPDYVRHKTDFSAFKSQTKLFLKERIVGN